MIVKVQTCWSGHADRFCFRALICGGLRIGSETGIWTRRDASRMLDLLEVELGVDRRNVRFRHV